MDLTVPKGGRFSLTSFARLKLVGVTARHTMSSTVTTKKTVETSHQHGGRDANRRKYRAGAV